MNALKRIDRLVKVWKTKAQNAKTIDDFNYDDGYSDGLDRAARILRAEPTASFPRKAAEGSEKSAKETN